MSKPAADDHLVELLDRGGQITHADTIASAQGIRDTRGAVGGDELELWSMRSVDTRLLEASVTTLADVAEPARVVR